MYKNNTSHFHANFFLDYYVLLIRKLSISSMFGYWSCSSYLHLCTLVRVICDEHDTYIQTNVRLWTARISHILQELMRIPPIIKIG